MDKAGCGGMSLKAEEACTLSWVTEGLSPEGMSWCGQAGGGREAWWIPPCLCSVGELPEAWTQGRGDTGLAWPCVSDCSRPPQRGACARGAPTSGLPSVQAALAVWPGTG